MVLESCDNHEESVISQEDGDQTQAPPPNFVVVKEYQPRGELKLHRLSSSTTFTCGRCNNEKTAKLIAIYRNRWDDLRCNACYGQLLLKI